MINKEETLLYVLSCSISNRKIESSTNIDFDNYGKVVIDNTVDDYFCDDYDTDCCRPSCS